MNIPKLLSKHRARAGISYHKAAAKTGLNVATVHRLHTRETGPPPEPRLLRAMAELYEIKLTDLMIAAGHLGKSEAIIKIDGGTVV